MRGYRARLDAPFKAPCFYSSRRRNGVRSAIATSLSLSSVVHICLLPPTYWKNTLFGPIAHVAGSRLESDRKEGVYRVIRQPSHCQEAFRKLHCPAFPCGKDRALIELAYDVNSFNGTKIVFGTRLSASPPLVRFQTRWFCLKSPREHRR